MPDLCPVTLGVIEVEMNSFVFSTPKSASIFQKTVDTTGASFAFQVFELGAADVDSSIQENNNSLSSCLIRLICHQFPVASFHLDRQEMTFTASAIEQLRAIRSLTEAEEFMLRYGSHISTGDFQLGGILWHKLLVTTEKPVAPGKLEELATKWLNAGGPHSVTTSLPSTTATLRFESETLGPSVFNPCLFKQTLLSNSDTWHVIDRGGLSSLVPVWELATDLYPELKNQCEFLRNAWLVKTYYIPVPFIQKQRSSYVTEEESLYLTLDSSEVIKSYKF